MPSAAILAFIDAAERDIQHLHSLMLLRRGQVLAEGWWAPYDPPSPHLLFSLSKSFTATAIGLLAAEGRLSLDDPVLGFFPAEAPPAPSANMQAMRVRHLLTMTAGHATDPTEAVFRQTSQDWVTAFLAQPVAHPPGSHFVYNTAATYMLSAIAQQLTAQRLRDYLQPRLFAPLGIARPRWEVSPQGIDVGGSGMSATTEDIARFGQLYLDGGQWQGRRLLPEGWVQVATAAQVPNGPAQNVDWGQGYGYQFWRCQHGAYRGDGAFGQFCLVLPAQEAVLAITAGVPNMQRVLDLVWQHLLPAFGRAPLPADRAAQAALAERLTRLQLPPPAGQRRSPRSPELTGRTFRLRENDDRIAAIRFDFADDGATFAIENDRGEQRIRCGYETWERGMATLEHGTLHRQTFDSSAPWPVAAAGAWLDEQTYLAQLWWYETPFRRTLSCRFDGDRLTVQQRLNVAFGPTERPTLQGQLLPAE